MIEEIKQKKPLILCLTNHVVMNFTANVLLAIGASPVMSLEKSDIEDLSRICNGILINIGTIDKNFIDLLYIAIESGMKYNLPIVFDPVGSGASKIRTEVSREISKIDYDRLIIKGNASEILSLEGDFFGRGVDSIHQSYDAITIAKNLGKIVCITGKDDYVVHRNELIKISNGSIKMQRITGTGCALGALVSAFASIEFSIKNIANAISFFGIAGEVADNNSDGAIGTFEVKLIDALSGMDNEKFESRKKIENL